MPPVITKVWVEGSVSHTGFTAPCPMPLKLPDNPSARCVFLDAIMGSRTACGMFFWVEINGVVDQYSVNQATPFCSI
jgi:hypothetical protein